MMFVYVCCIVWHSHCDDVKFKQLSCYIYIPRILTRRPGTIHFSANITSLVLRCTKNTGQHNQTNSRNTPAKESQLIAKGQKQNKSSSDLPSKLPRTEEYKSSAKYWQAEALIGCGRHPQALSAARDAENFFKQMLVFWMSRKFWLGRLLL